MAENTWTRRLSAAGALVVVTLAVSLAAVRPAAAEVDRIEILERVPFAGGKSFGNVGPYERLRGRLYFTVEANAPENQPIVDIKLAPRDAQGRVHFTTDFILLKPADPARANGRILYDVNNRGDLTALRAFNDGRATNLPTTAEDAGTGFLMEQGYAVLASGWSWDVTLGDNRLRADLPVATDGGKPIYGRVEGEVTVVEPANTASHVGILSVGYEPAKPDDPDAVLTVRDSAFGTRTPIARNRWFFGERAPGSDHVIYDPSVITLDGGFKPGSIYTVSYVARGPRVEGLGLAGIRDALTFLRHERADHYGTSNPLGENGADLPKTVLAYGASQSARVLQTMVFYGLLADGRGRVAFDGALMKAPGGGKGGFNYRFGQASRHFSPDVELDYPSDWFPFSTAPQTDPVTSETRSVLDHDTLSGMPKLFYVNTATEYWTRSASLTHTTADASADLAPDRRARIYTIAGAQHRIATPAAGANLAHCLDPLDERPILRSLLLHLDAWVTLKQEPPVSSYPTLADGTLGKLSQYIDAFPKIPGVRTPSRLLEPPRLDLGPRFVSDGIADVVPPKVGKTYPTLVPLPDKDGLDKGGIRLPEITAPLGTYVGWNLYNAATGTPDRLARFDGSFVPFARNENDRLAAGDPRLSIAERYASRDAYRQAYAAATLALAEQGLILGSDVNTMVERAGAFYDRLMARDTRNESCGYLFAKK